MPIAAFGWMFIGIGLLIAMLAIPLAAGKVPRNRWYGFRTPRTVADERLWGPVNEMAGRTMVPMGAGMALLGAAVLAHLLSLEAATGLSLAVTMLPVLFMMWQASVIAARVDGRLADTPAQGDEEVDGASEAEAKQASRPQRRETESP